MGHFSHEIECCRKNSRVPEPRLDPAIPDSYYNTFSIILPLPHIFLFQNHLTEGDKISTKNMLFHECFLIIFYVLCYYSYPDFSPFACLHSATPTTSGNTHTLFMSMGDVCKFFGYSISYTVLYTPMAIL